MPSAAPARRPHDAAPASRDRSERKTATRSRRHSLLIVGLTAAVALLVAACASATREQDADLAGPDATGSAAPPAPEVTGTITEDVAVPWDIAFLPDGSALVTERETALLKRVTPAGEVAVVGEIPDVVPGGEGGLMGIALGPEFEQTGHLYAYYTAAEDNRVVRMTYADGRVSGQEPILTGIEKAPIHNGGRIAFGPDGMLHVATGDAGNGEAAQDPDSPNGTLLRVTPEGEPAPGNPDGDAVYSLGHRNVQGLAWDGAGNLWISELGANTYDELNLIEPGANYGWPACEGSCDDGRFVNPEATWSPAEASPSPLAYADGALWMGALRGERLWGIPVADGEVAGEPADFFAGEYGRWRAIVAGGDGTFWAATNAPDRILEITVGE